MKGGGETPEFNCRREFVHARVFDCAREHTVGYGEKGERLGCPTFLHGGFGSPRFRMSELLHGERVIPSSSCDFAEPVLSWFTLFFCNLQQSWINYATHGVQFSLQNRGPHALQPRVRVFAVQRNYSLFA